MRTTSERSVRKPRKLALELGVVLCIVAVLGMILYPALAGTSTCYIRSSCLSNLKQLGTAVAIYESDSDDDLPPFYTFDGKKATEQFVAATMPYAREESIYKCLLDHDKKPRSNEQTSEKMTWVHALSMKSLIPSYGSGNRTLHVPDGATSLASIVYLRDPIQGFGTSSVGEGQTSDPAFLTLHGNYFTRLFLDTHVKFKQNIVDQSEL